MLVSYLHCNFIFLKGFCVFEQFLNALKLVFCVEVTVVGQNGGYIQSLPHKNNSLHSKYWAKEYPELHETLVITVVSYLLYERCNTFFVR